MPSHEGNWLLCPCSEFSHFFRKSRPEGQKDMLFFSRTDLNTTTPRRSLSLCKRPVQAFPPTSDLVLFHILRGARVREAHGAVGAELGPTVCRHQTWEKCNKPGHQWKWSEGSLTAKGEAYSQVWPEQGRRGQGWKILRVKN